MKKKRDLWIQLKDGLAVLKQNVLDLERCEKASTAVPSEAGQKASEAVPSAAQKKASEAVPSEAVPSEAGPKSARVLPGNKSIIIFVSF
jgi:hypothetical protein